MGYREGECSTRDRREEWRGRGERNAVEIDPAGRGAKRKRREVKMGGKHKSN